VPSSGEPPREPTPDIRCIPKHAGRPIALCTTGSGSGWWIRWIGRDGYVVYGPYVPNAGTLAGQPDRVLVDAVSPTTDRRVIISWHARQRRLEISTRYADGKPYRFLIYPDGRIEFLEW